MACGGCQKRGTEQLAARQSKEDENIMGEYAILTSRQLNSRLEVYKRRYCRNCSKRYSCNYEVYVSCRKKISSE